MFRNTILENIEEIQKMEEKYNNYIKRHKEAVINSFEDMMSCPEIMDLDYFQNQDIIDRLRSEIQNHDESKYSEEEYEPYRKHYDPINDEEALNTEEYECAWLHHYSNNPHHWEYWCVLNPDTGCFELKDDIDEEEYKFYEIERLCDWCAMSRQFENRVKDWVEQNSEKIVQPDFIIDFQNRLIDIIDRNEIDISKDDVMEDEENKD